MFLMLQFFRTNRQMEFVCSIEDLASLTWMGDREMHTFRHKWSMITESIPDRLPQETLASVLAKKLERSNELKDDMAHYGRCEDGHAEHKGTVLTKS